MRSSRPTVPTVGRRGDSAKKQGGITSKRKTLYLTSNLVRNERRYGRSNRIGLWGKKKTKGETNTGSDVPAGGWVRTKTMLPGQERARGKRGALVADPPKTGPGSRGKPKDKKPKQGHVIQGNTYIEEKHSAICTS